MNAAYWLAREAAIVLLGCLTGELIRRIRERVTTMALLSKQQILEADDRKFETVDCPEWGGEVRLKSITGTQRDAYEGSIISTNGNDRKVNMRNARAKLIVLCAVDEAGRQLFDSDDLNALSRKNAAPIDRLFDACRRLAGMSEADVERLTDDFGATPDDDATSV